jgi:hypothetical protein
MKNSQNEKMRKKEKIKAKTLINNNLVEFCKENIF